LYMFKFIAPPEKVVEIQRVFPNHTSQTKASSKGNYISVTIQMMASSAEEIIEKYRITSKIEGIISL
jgi:uncharacterized protein